MFDCVAAPRRLLKTDTNTRIRPFVTYPTDAELSYLLIFLETFDWDVAEWLTIDP